MNDIIKRMTISNTDTKIKLNNYNNNNQTHKNLSHENFKQRRDSFGNPISKKNKIHKVTFIDEIEKGKLAEIKSVQSYRAYNKFEHLASEGNIFILYILKIHGNAEFFKLKAVIIEF